MKFAKTHGIKNKGTPAPSLDHGMDIVVWNTTVPNHAGELGVLATCIAKNSYETPIIAPLYREWFCGMIAVDTFEQTVIEQEDEVAVPRLLTEHANFGPNILVQQDQFGPQGAFDLLMAMYRK